VSFLLLDCLILETRTNVVLLTYLEAEQLELKLTSRFRNDWGRRAGRLEELKDTQTPGGRHAVRASFHKTHFLKKMSEKRLRLVKTKSHWGISEDLQQGAGDVSLAGSQDPDGAVGRPVEMCVGVGSEKASSERNLNSAFIWKYTSSRLGTRQLWNRSSSPLSFFSL